MKWNILFLAAASIVVTACSNEDDPVQNAQPSDKDQPALQVIAELEGEDVLTRANTAGVLTGTHPWSDQDAIRLFALDYTAFTSQGTVVKYEGADALNKQYAYKAADRTWEATDGDPITLSNIFARMYAYSPSFPDAGNDFYNGDAALSPLACPIIFNTPNKVDFLYGTHRNTLDGVTDADGDNTVDEGGSIHPNGTSLSYVDNKNPLLRLYLKHAQTYVRLKVVKNKRDADKRYPGVGKVTEVEVMQLKADVDAYGRNCFLPADGAHGAALPSKGTIDITTGEITPTAWAVPSMTDLINGTDKTSFILNDLPAGGTPTWNEGFCLLAPCEADMVRGFHLKVDDVDFYIACSSAERPVAWKPGFQYTYELVLTGKGLELKPGEDGEVVTIKPWNNGGTTTGDF